jgi:hypothetical protein
MVKRFLSALVLIAVVESISIWLVEPRLVHAQSSIASRVQVDPGVIGSATIQATATGATPTCTATVPAGYLYITAIEYTLVCGTTTCTATAANNVSTTNLGGAAFTVPSTGWGAAAGTASTTFFPFSYSPLRSSAPGTNVTIGAFPAVTNGTWRCNIWGYTNPY